MYSCQTAKLRPDIFTTITCGMRKPYEKKKRITVECVHINLQCRVGLSIYSREYKEILPKNKNKNSISEIKEEVVTSLSNYNGQCLFCQMPSRFVSLCTSNVFVMEIISLTVTADRLYLHIRWLLSFECQATLTFYCNKCWSTNLS